MTRLFAPETVAVVGATNSTGKMGYLVTKRLAAGFRGRLFPVHPSERTIAGLPAWRDLGAVPGPVDLAIALVPAERLLAVVQSCAPGQVRFMLAIPSGFGEVSAAGKRLEQRLVATAAERGMRVIGPNSAGLLNGPHGLNASLLPELPPAGPGLSCVTQSGGFAMGLWMYARNHQLSIAKICDLGNTADTEILEVLRHLRQDPETHVVGLFLEAVRQTEAFLVEVADLARAKPVVMTMLGRTLAGRRASLAHLGIASDPSQRRSWRGADGLIPAETGAELLNIAKGLSWQPSPRGRRVAILTGSGGVGGEIADLCVENGLLVPEPSAALQATLARHLPAYAGLRNPVDLTPIWWDYPKIYPPLVVALLASDEFDLIIVTVMDVATTVPALMQALKSLAEDRQFLSIGKPIHVFWSSTHDMLEGMRVLERARIPCYPSPLETVRAAAARVRVGLAQGAP